MKSPNEIVQDCLIDIIDKSKINADRIVEELYKAGYYFMWDSRRSGEYPRFSSGGGTDN